MRTIATAVIVILFAVAPVWAQTPAPAEPEPQQADEPADDSAATTEPQPATEGEPGFDDPQPGVSGGSPEEAATGYEAILGLVVLLAIGGAVWFMRRSPGVAAPPPAEPYSTPTPSAARTAPPPKGTSIFISYRREDSADIAGRITDRLVERFGKNAVFKDVDSIPIGRDFRTHLQDAVGRCDALLVLIGKQWSEASAHGKRRLDDPRDHLRIEIESALARDIPVIPVLVQGAAMPEEESLPQSLRPLAYRHAIPVRPDPDFNVDLDRLIKGMEAQFGTVPR